MVSQAEGVMLNETSGVIAPMYQELRTKASFQTMTGLFNKPNGAQTGHMQKCSLNYKPTWLSQNRSTGNALSFKFLSDYSSAVYANFIHAKNLCNAKKVKDKKALQASQPEIQAFRKLRAMEPNMVIRGG